MAPAVLGPPAVVPPLGLQSTRSRISDTVAHRDVATSRLWGRQLDAALVVNPRPGDARPQAEGFPKPSIPADIDAYLLRSAGLYC